MGWLLSNTWIVTSFDRNVEKLESSYVAVGNVKWCSPSGEVWRFLKKLNRVTFDPGVALLGIYPR